MLRKCNYGKITFGPFWFYTLEKGYRLDGLKNLGKLEMKLALLEVWENFRK